MIIIPVARSTTVAITYEGQDISEDLAPYLSSFTFTDNAKDKADDISLTLQDARGEWLRDWPPSKSDPIKATIIKQDSHGAQSLPCGTFTVDQCDYSLPPHTLSIKGVSAAVKGKAATAKRTRHWEQMTLGSILGQIAGENNLALMLEGDASVKFERLDQTEQTDLEFCRQICADCGLAVKIQTDRLVVYDKEQYEAQSPACEIWSDDDRLINARFSSKTAKVYKKAKLTYHNPMKDKDITGEYEDASVEGSEHELILHERAEDTASAERIAKQRLLEANRGEITGSLTLMGDVRLAAGLTVQLGGFGMFSGKHFINRCTHKVDTSGYTTTLELGQPQEDKAAGKERKAKRQSSKSKVKKGNPSSGEVYYEGERYYQ